MMLPIPECPKCSDTLWVECRDTRFADRCECFAGHKLRVLLQRAQIPERYSSVSFASFDVTRSPDSAAAVAACRDYGAGLGVGEVGGLLLTGPPGSGKTHLAVAILRAAIERGVLASFWDTQHLLDSVRATFGHDAEQSETALLRPAVEAELLVLDDLGKERRTDWNRSTISALINERYNRRRATVITSNYAAGLADHVGDRIDSRIAEMCRVVRLTADDYRKREL